LKEVLEHLEKAKHVKPGQHPEIITGVKRKHTTGPKIYSHKSILWRLPYWKDLKLAHNLDVMHIEKMYVKTFFAHYSMYRARPRTRLMPG
jgi:hypothetical protein